MVYKATCICPYVSNLSIPSPTTLNLLRHRGHIQIERSINRHPKQQTLILFHRTQGHNIVQCCHTTSETYLISFDGHGWQEMSVDEVGHCLSEAFGAEGAVVVG